MNIHFSDNTIFDRLADGELSPAERQELLASLDEREGGWRQCALAMLESQSWGRQLKELVAGSAEENLAAVVPQEQVKAGMGSYLSLAAGLLVAFTVGWFVRSPEASQTSDLQIAGKHRQEIALPNEFPEDQLSGDDVVTLVVRDASGKNRRMRVPLMAGTELDEKIGAADGLFPAELRSSLQRRGFDVQRRRRYAPMFFEQDRQLVPMVVPVEDTRVVPVSRPVY